MFEHIIASRLERHLEDVGLFDPTIKCFIKKRNANRCLNRLHNDIRNQLSKKYTVKCLFRDFEKAFDSVWKKELTKKFADAGVFGPIWKLINDFLFGRKVRLIFNNFTGFIRACRELGLPH